MRWTRLASLVDGVERADVAGRDGHDSGPLLSQAGGEGARPLRAEGGHPGVCPPELRPARQGGRGRPSRERAVRESKRARSKKVRTLRARVTRGGDVESDRLKCVNSMCQFEIRNLT